MYDYNELSLLVPELKNCIKDGNNLDYSCPLAVRLLNRALLLKEFDLDVDLPEGHLCPTVANRLSFIEKIELSLKHVVGKNTEDDKVTGIDIGTGTSCIYPLIACKRNPNWTFLATDIDDKAIKYASVNVERNNLQDVIKIIKNPDAITIFPSELISVITSRPGTFFLVCNPPFYTDTEDLETRASFKRHKPNNMSMTKDELGTELGGEVGFIKKMISESVETKSLCESINIFSCMLGMKESLNQLLDHFNSHYPNCSFAYEPLRIKHTTRYLLFWSFIHQIPKDASTHRLRFTAKSKRQQCIPVNGNDFDFESYIKKLQLKYGDTKSLSSSSSNKLLLKYNKWSRIARRSSEPISLPAPMEVSVEFDSKVGLIFSVDEGADWETFLGFINHLRKEPKE